MIVKRKSEKQGSRADTPHPSAGRHTPPALAGLTGVRVRSGEVAHSGMLYPDPSDRLPPYQYFGSLNSNSSAP